MKVKKVKAVKPKFIVRQFERACSGNYAVFRAQDIKRGMDGLITYADGVNPFRGYQDMTKEHAVIVMDRLEKECK